MDCFAIIRKQRLLVICAAAAAIATNLLGCGVADWLIGNNIDVNGARGTLTQEHVAIGGDPITQAVMGNKNSFAKVDVVPALTGGQSCESHSINKWIEFKEDIDANYKCVAWAFNCFYFYEPGQCPAPPPEGKMTDLTTQVNGVTPIRNGPAELFKSEARDEPNPKLQALKLRRNAVQERLIAASNSACRDFTQHLNTYQSYANLILGVAAVGTGAAGGIVSSTIAARALAGITGAISGTRAEFNSDLFAQKLVTTIVQAIDESRLDYLITLRGPELESAGRTLAYQRHQFAQPAAAAASQAAASSSPAADAAAAGAPRPAPAASPAQPGFQFAPNPDTVGKQKFSIVQYSVEAAIADAIFYNDLCSLDKGLQTLTQSLPSSIPVLMKRPTWLTRWSRCGRI